MKLIYLVLFFCVISLVLGEQRHRLLKKRQKFHYQQSLQQNELQASKGKVRNRILKFAILSIWTNTKRTTQKVVEKVADFGAQIEDGVAKACGIVCDEFKCAVEKVFCLPDWLNEMQPILDSCLTGQDQTKIKTAYTGFDSIITKLQTAAVDKTAFTLTAEEEAKINGNPIFTCVKAKVDEMVIEGPKEESNWWPPVISVDLAAGAGFIVGGEASLSLGFDFRKKQAFISGGVCGKVGIIAGVDTGIAVTISKSSPSTGFGEEVSLTVGASFGFGGKVGASFEKQGAALNTMGISGLSFEVMAGVGFELDGGFCGTYTKVIGSRRRLHRNAKRHAKRFAKRHAKLPIY